MNSQLYYLNVMKRNRISELKLLKIKPNAELEFAHFCRIHVDKKKYIKKVF